MWKHREVRKHTRSHSSELKNKRDQATCLIIQLRIGKLEGQATCPRQIAPKVSTGNRKLTQVYRIQKWKHKDALKLAQDHTAQMWKHRKIWQHVSDH